MKRYQLILWSALAGLAWLLPVPASAQTFAREGTLQLDMVNVIIDESDTILSSGTMGALETDPHFTGDLEDLLESGDSLLDEYTTVTRGGHFPENRGIPLSQQLTVDECVYRTFQLDNGNELMMYQSPQSDDVQYLIRGSN